MFAGQLDINFFCINIIDNWSFKYHAGDQGAFVESEYIF